MRMNLTPLDLFRRRHLLVGKCTPLGGRTWGTDRTPHRHRTLQIPRHRKVSGIHMEGGGFLLKGDLHHQWDIIW